MQHHVVKTTYCQGGLNIDERNVIVLMILLRTSTMYLSWVCLVLVIVTFTMLFEFDLFWQGLL